jgi:hypothetical protein
VRRLSSGNWQILETGSEPLLPLNLRRRRFSEHLSGLPPGCTAPEDGPAQNGIPSHHRSSDCLSMRRSGDIAISWLMASLSFRRSWDQRFESALLQRSGIPALRNPAKYVAS